MNPSFRSSSVVWASASVLALLGAAAGCSPSLSDAMDGTGESGATGGLDESGDSGASASASASASATATATAGDGDSATTTAGDGDGTATAGDGDGTSVTAGDGDGTSVTAGDGDGTSVTATAGDGDGTAGDGDGTSVTAGDGDGTAGDGDGDGTTTAGDGDGSACPDPLLDSDMDSIPDCDDPFPMDPNLPGISLPNVIYAHTSNELFTMLPVPPYTITSVGTFSFDQQGSSITDIALDQYGVLYAVSFNDIYVCDPQDASCVWLGDLSESFNGLTLVPPGFVNPDRETIVGISGGGNWYAVDVGNQVATVNQYGSYGMGLTNAGDVFSIANVGTWGATNPTAVWSCNPATGNAISMVADLASQGYSCVYGLAGWENAIFAFNCGGEVVEVDPTTGAMTELVNAPQSWWGAGVRTLIPM